MGPMDFIRKPVASLTLGEKLKKIRSEHRITLAEVSRATRIQVKYLEAIEGGAFDSLPPEVYVRGFLRSYAAFLGVSEEAILKLYERERSIQKNLGHVEHAKFQPKAPVHFSFVFSTKTLVMAGISAITLSFFGYLFLEFRSFVSEPRLVIFEPADGARIVGSEATIRGEADPRSDLSMNGELVPVDENGAFSESLKLASGTNTIHISAKNRFGKTRTKTLSLEVADPRPAAPPAAERSAITLALRATATATVSVRSDGTEVFSGPVTKDEERVFSGYDTIVVSSDRGDVLFVRFGEGEEEPLSPLKSSVEVIFGRNGRLQVQ